MLAQEGLRLEVSLDEIDPVVVDALVAAEDRRFYDHTGIDPAGIVRALWNNLTDDSTQGGSTLTQQLVKNTYLTSDRTLTRKVREAVLAIKLERTEDKDVILERYLNTVYFGRGAYGIEAAARSYFDATRFRPHAGAGRAAGRDAPRPRGLRPRRQPRGRREERRNAVLGDHGRDMGSLDAAEAERAQAAADGGRPVEPTPDDPAGGRRRPLRRAGPRRADRRVRGAGALRPWPRGAHHPRHRRPARRRGRGGREPRRTPPDPRLPSSASTAPVRCGPGWAAGTSRRCRSTWSRHRAARAASPARPSSPSPSLPASRPATAPARRSRPPGRSPWTPVATSRGRSPTWATVATGR